MGILSTLALGVIASLLAAVLVYCFRKRKRLLRLFPPGLSSHFKELEQTIRKMPFLYEGIEASVMHDFVGLEITPLDHSTLRLPMQMFTCTNCGVAYGEVEYRRGQRTLRCTKCQNRKPLPKSNERGPSDRLREWRKIIFLGGAGIGKTTFQRFTILSILKKKSKPDFLQDKENPIPFYVPLKAVANTMEFPIIKYLLANNSYLSRMNRRKALNKLRVFAETERLFLFLDGYDEIQLAAGRIGAGYIQQELNFILGTELFPKKTLNREDQDAGFGALYRSLSNCRVWVSSRWEFYEQHRLNTFSSDESKPNLVFAVEIQGIADNRQSLIQKIFNKHKSEAIRFDDWFNAEYFLHEIETARERELVDLSYNPLFLTIMCFIYASAVISQGKHDVNWVTTFNELIGKCIDLLVRKLDEDKLQGESPALKDAILARRGEYPVEKEQFLRYFAFKLFDDDTRLFELEYIKEKAIDFFHNRFDSINKDRILVALEEDELLRPHIGRQLTYSGIFVLVDKQQQNTLYDFPHLRFRELLAVEYVINNDPFYLVNNLDKRSLSELLYVFFNRSTLQESVLTEIFKRVKNNPEPEFFSALLLNCLSSKPAEFNANAALRDFLLQCVRTDSFFTIRSEVLQFFQPDANFIQEIADQFDIGLSETQTNKLLLSCHLLSYYEKAVFRDHVVRKLLPQFRIDDTFLGRIVVNHKELEDTIKAEDIGANLKEFFRLSKIFDSIKRENRTISWPKDHEPEYCFIVTDEILQGVLTFVQRQRTQDVQVTPDQIRALGIKLRFKVFFSTHFLGGEFRPLHSDVREHIIEQSKVEYQLCRDILTTLDHAKKNPPLGTFFN